MLRPKLFWQLAVVCLSLLAVSLLALPLRAQEALPSPEAESASAASLLASFLNGNPPTAAEWARMQATIWPQYKADLQKHLQDDQNLSETYRALNAEYLKLKNSIDNWLPSIKDYLERSGSLFEAQTAWLNDFQTWASAWQNQNQADTQLAEYLTRQYQAVQARNKSLEVENAIAWVVAAALGSLDVYLAVRAITAVE
jgi:hypothetical protein